MLVTGLEDCEEFIAGDATRLRELLHPDKAALDIRYSLAHALVEPGLSTTAHRLKTSEVYYIIQGEGLAHVDGETAGVLPGQAVYIPPGAVQYITNTGGDDLEFLCIVDPAWRAEDEEIL
jgi:mannose-6-phosphate isomerase-like protein (cupin superfamily)